ncbi:MAG: hypothetical protein OEN50_06375 [Deltaproteobacteria bacterium]|nr:hypothetical protein [Deltaproteobacteria bacterium]
MTTPEDRARETIDELLEECGWAVQDKNAATLAVSRGVALRELSFKTGEPDYTLFVDGTEFVRPLIAVSEQERIVAEVERCLSVVKELEAVVNANLQRATRLRQSILQRAFEGRLPDRTNLRAN